MKKALENLLVPESYTSKMDIRQTETAIKLVKDYFERELADALNLTRVSAPLFVRPETGLNDNLNGVERPVSFDLLYQPGVNVEIVQSLAKWKRQALKRYGFSVGEGLYTDMNAIRRDEQTDNLHSIYVDQWDWERVINKADRHIDTLKDTVRLIYGAFRSTQKLIENAYPQLDAYLPEEITFLTTQQIEDEYPQLTASQRETEVSRRYGAIFLMQIGGKLKSGNRHDGRAPDYDDWSLNGDIIFYYPPLERAFEVSSMGIRVDEAALKYQLAQAGCTERAELPFQRELLNGNLPYTIGGGIGQSRMCMFFLNKVHIGEVQSSIWPDEMLKACLENNIMLL